MRPSLVQLEQREVTGRPLYRRRTGQQMRRLSVSSNATSVSISAPTTVDEVYFAPRASPFTITATQNDNNSVLSIDGIGITNSSGIIQKLHQLIGVEEQDSPMAFH